MNRTKLFAVIAALALAALTAGVYGFNVLNDPQKSAPQRGTRPRPPGAPATGQAVPRPSPPARPRPAGPGRVAPYPYGYRYPYPGVTLGFWYDYPYPYGYPVPPGYVFAAPETASGSVRLDVSPKDAAVYVDGYYAGIVDDFKGVFRHLTLTAGPHSIEIRKPGFETLVVDVYVQPRQTITYRETMQPTQPGSSSAQAESGAVTAPLSSDVLLGAPGDLRLDVKPKDAQVYVDGYYVGIVDDFSGRYQRLNLAPGPHHVELRATGYELLAFDVNSEPRQTVDYRGNLTPSKP